FHEGELLGHDLDPAGHQLAAAPSATGSPRVPGPAIPPARTSRPSRYPWRAAARSASAGSRMSDWSSISPSRQSSTSSTRMNLSHRIVGASVMGLVALRWYVYAAILCGISTR